MSPHPSNKMGALRSFFLLLKCPIRIARHNVRLMNNFQSCDWLARLFWESEFAGSSRHQYLTAARSELSTVSSSFFMLRYIYDVGMAQEEIVTLPLSTAHIRLISWMRKYAPSPVTPEAFHPRWEDCYFLQFVGQCVGMENQAASDNVWFFSFLFLFLIFFYFNDVISLNTVTK